MSKVSDAFESEIVCMVQQNIGKSLPANLPRWMIDEGIVPGATIQCAEGIGSKSRKNKTDVIIYLDQGQPIKISAKLMNADYFGNWYGHARFLEEFGRTAFQRMTRAATEWANNWINRTRVPFVGVSICFGRRSGETGQDFLDIFTLEDILTVARGYGCGNHVANCLYIANTSARTIPELIQSLEAVSVENVNRATENFKVVYRPINPMTEGSNRKKNVYTRFLPYGRLRCPTKVTQAEELFALGNFVKVESSGLNHDDILDDLEINYNIIIPRKE